MATHAGAAAALRSASGSDRGPRIEPCLTALATAAVSVSVDGPRPATLRHRVAEGP